MIEKIIKSFEFRKKDLITKYETERENETSSKNMLPPDIWKLQEIQGRINEITTIIEILKIIKVIEEK